MKLRLRSLESKETTRIEVPDTCTVQNLKAVLSERLSSSSSSFVRLSLNRKDELLASSEQDSLRSIGVASGDLIFYTLYRSGFSSALASQGPDMGSFQQDSHRPPSLEEDAAVSGEDEKLIQVGNSDHKKPKLEDYQAFEESVVAGPETWGPQSGVSIPSANCELQESGESSGVDSMNIDDASAAGAGKSYELSLRRMLREELGEDRNAHKLLVISVHSVLLESGFTGFDSVSDMRIDRFRVPDEWPSTSFTMSLWYTLPELLDNGGNASHVTEAVMLKFQSLGRFVNVYGSIADTGSNLYRVCLDEYKFAPALDLVWASCGSGDRMDDDENFLEGQVFEFWKMVKDGLALPLLIDLCEKAGLPSPPCFMRLPAELKMKILEDLPGVDVARVACVCKELQFLSSNNDLWKQKVDQEFGCSTGLRGMGRWKERFATSWERKKKKSNRIIPWRRYPRIGGPFYFHVRRYPDLLRFLPMIGGDGDRFPSHGIASPFGHPGRGYSSFQAARRFSPNCSFGGFNV